MTRDEYLDARVVEVAEPGRPSRLKFDIADGIRIYPDMGMTPAALGVVLAVLRDGDWVDIARSVAWQGQTGWQVSPFAEPDACLGLRACFGFKAGDRLFFRHPAKTEDR